MLILKRLAVWLLETTCETLLMGLFMTVFFGFDRHAFGMALLFYASAVALMSYTTGYLLTTAILRAVWKSQRLWLYPIVSTVPFFIHSQIFFVDSGGSTPSEKLAIRAAGACIVFACTLAGTFALQKWALTSSK
jgi:hypothetical protein